MSTAQILEECLQHFEKIPEKVPQFIIAAIGLEHGHIFGMCESMIRAGASMKWVYDKDVQKSIRFQQKFPEVKIAQSEEQVLADPEVQLICSADVTSERADLGIRCMEAGKDYFVDKAPMTTLDQLARAKDAVKRTGRKYMVYYGERLHNEAAVFAGELVHRGLIGKVIHIDGFGPHRLGDPASRPDWFYQMEKYGGILCDIGSHQIEQFLYYCDEEDAVVTFSHAANYHHPDHPELQDFGEAILEGKNGATQHFRVDWLNPDGLSTWGDGRTFLLGTEGYIELRKYCQVGEQKPNSGNQVYLVNKEGEFHLDVSGKIGFPFFRELILDCLNRTENAMTQEHAFKAAELCVRASMQAGNPLEKKG